jgi:lipopolysaccharide assembly outer membrane protein LptD (OstA)
MFTTCESDTPHTHFTASQMKVIQKDKIVARWIFMYIGGVPFPIPLPFAVFPNESGRRSGLIIPTFGDAGNRGSYLYNFGYFWAMNDYMDLTFTGDYYFKGGYGLRSRYRYTKKI